LLFRVIHESFSFDGGGFAVSRMEFRLRIAFKPYRMGGQRSIWNMERLADSETWGYVIIQPIVRAGFSYETGLLCTAPVRAPLLCLPKSESI
jgi:hypothetical protein